ncbi:MAG: transposase, partial [Parvularculaceae bacterium]|nr:transposase [Parvularculaceae bacterium]
MAIISLAERFGRYGYRRITALLREAGWSVSTGRVYR